MRSWLLAAGVGVLLLAGCGSVPTAPGGTPTQNASKTATPSASASSSQQAAAGCGAQPALQFTAGLAAGALTSVQFVSLSRGWVVGAQQILATTNGGRTWTAQYSGKLNLLAVDFIGNEVGWAVGADTLLATSDGGQRWTALPEPCPVIRSVHFVSASTGFAIAGGADVLAHGSLAPAAGGRLLRSTDGGRIWQQLSAPANPQSVCFTNSRDGWLGADGALYRSTDGGRTWKLTTTAPGRSDAGYPFTMIVQCAGASSAWALDAGSGAAMSQEPHIGYHAGPDGTVPIFAEQYFPHPGVTVTASSPGSYTGTLSAISASTAVFIDFCPACGYGSAPWDLITGSGSVLKPEGHAGGITQAYGASFLTPSTGWVVGVLTDYSNPNQPRSYPRIMYTDNGGQTWQVQYSGG